MRRRARRGFTILEAVVALFVIVTAAIFSGQMLRLSLEASGTVRDESLALMMCQRRVREIVEWSRETESPGAYRFNRPWPDGTGGQPAQAPFAEQSDTAYPQFRVWAKSAVVPLDSPAPRMRGYRLNASLRAVRVTASWGRGREVSLVALVGEPPRAITTLRITGAPTGAMTPGQQVTLRAQALEGNEVIPDVSYRWDLLPMSGNVTLVPTAAPDRSTVTVVNAFRYPDRVRRCTGGRCRVRVRAWADGRRVAQWVELDLGAVSGALSP